MVKKKLKHQDYTVAWIYALPKEESAAICMLDQRHADLPSAEADDNEYVLGEVHGHNVVIACLPSGVMGKVSAGRVATLFKFTFPAIRFGLMVGIGGGVPTQDNDMRLGDVAVGIPDGAYPGVIQYDFGKVVQEGSFIRTGSLDNPPAELLTRISKLRAKHDYHASDMPQYIEDVGNKFPKMEKKYCLYPGGRWDKLFQAEYDHPIGASKSCPECDLSKLVSREPREDQESKIHYGTIASGDEVMKHGLTRDRLQKEHNILCFEMEAAGVERSGIPSLVIRGICDYSDSHKSDRWQEYAAIVAAAYAKELFCSFEPRAVKPILKPVGEEGENKASSGAIHLKDEPTSSHQSWNNTQYNTGGGRAIQGLSSGGNINIG
ncbi:MAG: hypothetical protein Q9165_001255 [Trypethelium subeluteriae]